jgi:hypothetical protein
MYYLRQTVLVKLLESDYEAREKQAAPKENGTYSWRRVLLSEPSRSPLARPHSTCNPSTVDDGIVLREQFLP